MNPRIESYIDQSFVINMDRDKERLKVFMEMMDRLQWKVERFPAVVGKNLTDDERNLKTQYIKLNNMLTKSEIGCFLSHLKLWIRVAEDPNLNRIAIFEDDARTHIGINIHSKISEFYEHLSKNNIPEPGMLYLGKALDYCMKYEQVWESVYRNSYPLCMHAYVITKDTARKLISVLPDPYAIDVIVVREAKAKKFEIMSFHPSIFYQDVINNASNLRDQKFSMNNTTECIVPIKFLDYAELHVTVVLVMMLISAILLFIIFFPN